MAGRLAALGPLLAVVAMALALTICGAAEDGLVAVGGRFMARGAGGAEHGRGRKLLTFNFCGAGSAPNYSCKTLFPLFVRSTCCTGALEIKTCKDLSIDILNCGSCGTACGFGRLCCNGVCSNILTDRNNCLVCGKRCPGNLPCQNGICGYNGF